MEKQTINIDFPKFNKDMENYAKELINSRGRDIINQMFQKKGYWNQPEGPMQQLLRERIEAYALSEEFAKKMDEAIARNIDAALDNAAKTLLKSRTRKAFFEQPEK